MIDRKDIIKNLKLFFEDKEYVRSMWLNGSDAQFAVDKYSDLDVVFNVKEEKLDYFFEEILAFLDTYYKIDFRLDEDYTDAKAACIHLMNTSEYLLIDLYIQCTDNYCISNTDNKENAKIIFDKAQVNKFEDYNPNIDEINNLYLYNKGKMIQESRIKKYIIRNKFLEAYAKYIEYIVEPLITIGRLDYVPQYHYFKLCHISKHFPEKIVTDFTELYKINDFESIENNMKKCRKMLRNFEMDLNEKYGIDINKISYLS